MPKYKPICIIIDPVGQARRYDLNNDKYADDELFEAVPAADVRPVVRGKWGHRWICSNLREYEYACSCSACGEPTYRVSLLEEMPHFCPNCGADMREES